MSRRRMLLAAGAASKPKYGAFIQDTTGKLWAADEWDGSATPNGIAVRDITYGPSEGILLAILSTLTKVYFNTKGISMPTTPDNLRNQDFDGEARSQSLLADVGISSLPAISECVSYVFPDGQNGYLGAFGEMRLIYDCLSEIKKCLSALGIEKDLFNNDIWTCTASEKYTTSSSLYIYSFKPSDLSIVLSLGGFMNSQEYVWPIGKVGDWSK